MVLWDWLTGGPPLFRAALLRPPPDGAPEQHLRYIGGFEAAPVQPLILIGEGEVENQLVMRRRLRTQKRHRRRLTALGIDAARFSLSSNQQERRYSPACALRHERTPPRAGRPRAPSG